MYFNHVPLSDYLYYFRFYFHLLSRISVSLCFLLWLTLPTCLPAFL